MSERRRILLPFPRVGLEAFVPSMEPRTIELPIPDELFYAQSFLLGPFLATPGIAEDLLVQVFINGSSVRRVAGFCSASLLNEFREVGTVLRRGSTVAIQVKPLRNMLLDCGFLASFTHPVDE